MNKPRLCILPLALLLLLLVTGCTPSSGEKQIFPICMSMDRLEDGRMQLSVQVMSMAAEDEYAVFSAAGDSFRQALEILGASMPYPLHFGQLRLCIISYGLAAEQDLRSLLEPVARLSTIGPQVTAVVSMGNAAEVMAAQKPDLGVRLSTYLDQLLARLRQEGLMPEESMQEVLHMLESGYGDPLLGLCALNGQVSPEEKPGSSSQGESSTAGAASPAFQQSGSIAIGEPSPGADLPPALTAGALPRQGGNPVEYTGCAPVSGDRIAGTLTAAETRLALRLRNCATVTWDTSSEVFIRIPEDMSLEDAAQLVTKMQAFRCDLLRMGAALAKQCLTTDAFRSSAAVEHAFGIHLTITYK